MPSALVPVVLIVGVLIVQFLVQLGLRNRFAYQCPNCGNEFNPSPLSMVIAPHRLGGRKYTRCPGCGVRAWAQPVAKAR